jgi:hypothetical protein
VKPEHRFDQHVETRGEVVLAADVGKLVFEDGGDLSIVQSCADTGRPEQERPRGPDDARFEGAIHRDQLQGRVVATRLDLAKNLDLAPGDQESGPPNQAPQSHPPSRPADQEQERACQPHSHSEDRDGVAC